LGTSPASSGSSWRDLDHVRGFAIARFEEDGERFDLADAKPVAGIVPKQALCHLFPAVFQGAGKACRRHIDLLGGPPHHPHSTVKCAKDDIVAMPSVGACC
jgi:hypothetical protein